jgi:YD repeat-containing protein
MVCATAGSGMPVGKVISETTPLGSISYSYDSIGRRTSMTVAGQPTVNYSYDTNSRLTGILTIHPTLGTLDLRSIMMPSGAERPFHFPMA